MPTLTPTRAPAIALLPAAAVAGFGLGLTGLALTMPPPFASALPAIAAHPTTGPARDTARAVLPDWAPVFGTVVRAAAAPQVVVSVPDDDEDDPLPVFDEDALILRGIVADESGGFALVETPEGMLLVRVGDWLPEDIEVIAIIPDGIEVSLDGEYFLLEFRDDRPDEDLDDDFDAVTPERHDNDGADRPSFPDPRDHIAPPSPQRDRFGTSR